MKDKRPEILTASLHLDFGDSSMLMDNYGIFYCTAGGDEVVQISWNSVKEFVESKIALQRKKLLDDTSTNDIVALS